MAQGVRLLQHALNVACLCSLVLEPDLLQVLLRIFALKKVAENQLVLVDGLFGNDQSEGPAHLIVESEGLVHLKSARGRRRHLVHVHILLLALCCVSTEGFGAEGTPHNPSHEKLVRKRVPIQDWGDIVFELIRVHTRCTDSHFKDGLKPLHLNIT